MLFFYFPSDLMSGLSETVVDDSPQKTIDKKSNNTWQVNNAPPSQRKTGLWNHLKRVAQKNEAQDLYPTL